MRLLPRRRRARARRLLLLTAGVVTTEPSLDRRDPAVRAGQRLDGDAPIFCGAPHLSWGGSGGGARDRAAAAPVQIAHDELEFPRAQLEVRLEGAFHLA